ESVRVVGGESRGRRSEYLHRVGVVGERLEEVFHVLPQQRVAGYRLLVGLQLRLGGELAVLEEVGHLEEAASIGELLDRIATVTEDPFLAVDVADGGAGLGGVGEPAVERDQPGLGPQPSDVYGDLT